MRAHARLGLGQLRLHLATARPLAAGRAPAAGLALELASPLLPRAFLLLACLGSVARAVTGVAGGATRHALTQHFALQRNTADIAAKEGSQVGRRTEGPLGARAVGAVGSAGRAPRCVYTPVH